MKIIAKKGAIKLKSSVYCTSVVKPKVETTVSTSMKHCNSKTLVENFPAVNNTNFLNAVYKSTKLAVIFDTNISGDSDS
jgi:hypothetical protein